MGLQENLLLSGWTKQEKQERRRKPEVTKSLLYPGCSAYASILMDKEMKPKRDLPRVPEVAGGRSVSWAQTSQIAHLCSVLHTMLLLPYIISERKEEEWWERRRRQREWEESRKREERKGMPGERKRNFKAANKNKLLNKAPSLHWTFDNYVLSAC